MINCPNCGGNVKFDIPSQQLDCENCQTLFDPYTFDKQTSDAIEESVYDATIFTCPQCGGEILSTDTSAAEFCTFCGASTILHSRIQKEKRPKYIIPFKKTKEDCKQAYHQMVKRAIFAPDALKNPKYIDGFRGIYMPYWTFHLTQQGPFQLNGSRSYRKGDYIHTEHFALHGEIDAYYKGLSYDASSSFDDNISEKLAPFDSKSMRAFTPGYLSGFYADIADVPASKYQEKAEHLAFDNSIKKVYRSFPAIKIDTVIQPSLLQTKTESIESTMFPVWFMSYRNGDRVAYTTINGQTGRIVADLPIDTKKYLIGSLILAIPIFLLLNLFFTILPSTLLGISALIALLSIILYFGEMLKIKKKETVTFRPIGLFSAIASIVIWAVLWFSKPASDIFYYGGTIVALMGVFLMIKDVISYYNIMATRKLPQFDRKGGDDRA